MYTNVVLTFQRYLKTMVLILAPIFKKVPNTIWLFALQAYNYVLTLIGLGIE